MIPAKPTLLIVEDDDRIRSVVCAAAARSKAFATILDEHDGQAALDLIWDRVRTNVEELPDFILSDLSMPRLDGLELTRELKRHPETSGIPIAIMTSSNRPNDRSDAQAAGCCAFFDKPVRFDDFVKIVEAVPNLCSAHST